MSRELKHFAEWLNYLNTTVIFLINLMILHSYWVYVLPNETLFYDYWVDRIVRRNLAFSSSSWNKKVLWEISFVFLENLFSFSAHNSHKILSQIIRRFWPIVGSVMNFFRKKQLNWLAFWLTCINLTPQNKGLKSNLRFKAQWHQYVLMF